MNESRKIDYERLLEAIIGRKMAVPAPTDEDLIRTAIENMDYDFPDDKKLSINDVQVVATVAINALKHQVGASEDYVFDNMYRLTSLFMDCTYDALNVETSAAVSLLEATFNYMRNNVVTLMAQESLRIGSEMAQYKSSKSAETMFNRGVSQPEESYRDMLKDMVKTYHDRIGTVSRLLATAIFNQEYTSVCSLTGMISLYSDAVALCSDIIVETLTNNVSESNKKESV